MRLAPERTGPERAMLEGFLDFHRQTLLDKCSDLTGEQLAQRAVPPSRLSLQGLVRHLAGVERWWFRQHMCGMRLPMLGYTREQPDLDFEGVDPAHWKGDLEVYGSEVAAARDAVADVGLDATAQGPGGEVISLRWVYLHMIAEYARHNGHADLLRESIDGSTGW